MSHAILSSILLISAALLFGIFWVIRKSGRDGWLYLLASLSLLFFTAAVLVWAPDVYHLLGGKSFIAGGSVESGQFDAGTYSGFLQVLFGVPVAVAGSFYAILLARQSERQTRHFNAYEIRKDFRNRLEQRNAIVGRLAKSLKDINNASFIIMAQVSKVRSALPKDRCQIGESPIRVDQEITRIKEDGLVLLRRGFEDYRNALIGVQEFGIALDREPRPPLDTIKAHFYPSEDENRKGFILDLFDRDYHAIADRFLIRANRLTPEDLIRASLERTVLWVARWSEDEELHTDWPDLRGVLGGDSYDPTTADVNGLDDSLGYRFIGSALIRIDRVNDSLDLESSGRRVCGIDVGTAALLDFYQALPSKTRSNVEIRQWDEWKSLDGIVEESEKERLLATVPEQDLHFSRGFVKEVQRIQAMYDYVGDVDKTPDDEKKKPDKISAARTDFRALFYDVTPSWLDSEYERLSSQIASAVPPTHQELNDRLACIGVGGLLSRKTYARKRIMAAIARVVSAMNGVVEEQFIQLGDVGAADFRSCLLTCWAEQTKPEQTKPEWRARILGQLEELSERVGTDALRFQLNLDLGDCHAALGNAQRSSEYYGLAKTLFDRLSDEQLRTDPRIKQNLYFTFLDGLEFDRHIVWLHFWLHGYLLKQRGEYSIQSDGKPYLLPDSEIAMPGGMLPMFWGLLVHEGAIRLHQDVKPTLILMEEAYLNVLIKPNQGGWDLDLALANAVMTKQFAATRQDDQIQLEILFKEYSGLIENDALLVVRF